MPISLPNGCRIGKISVHPINWEDKDADLSDEWYIHYRFHHPFGKSKFPKGYPVKIRGMNDEQTLQERRRVTRHLISSELDALKNGHNPIPVRFGIGMGDELHISPYTGFMAALLAAFKLVPESRTKKRMTNALPNLQRAAAQLHFQDTPICEVRQRHLEVLLIKVSRNKKEEYDKLRVSLKPGQKPPPDEWGPEAYNHYRAYLQILFKMLKRLGANEAKPVDDIEKRKGIKKARVGLTVKDFEKIELLKRDNYTFWRLIHVFFRSGARETEMMGIQKLHVDMDFAPYGRYQVLVKKGRGSWEWVWKTITWEVRPLWEELMRDAAPGDYIFSKGLKPGAVKISERQITARWLLWGKKRLGIAADFYEFKHQYTTQVINKALRKIDEATRVAADLNNHKSTKMNREVYDLESGDRLHRELSSRG